MLNFIAALAAGLRAHHRRVPARRAGQSRVEADTRPGPSTPVHERANGSTWGSSSQSARLSLIWWILERSTFGFQVKAVGLNPHAARYAGMKVATITALTMAIAAGLAGIGGATLPHRSKRRADRRDHRRPRLRCHRGGAARHGPTRGGCSAPGCSSERSTPERCRMQAETQIPVDIVIVIQALIILFVAAPGLVRAIYRVRTGESDAPLVHLLVGIGMTGSPGPRASGTSRPDVAGTGENAAADAALASEARRKATRRGRDLGPHRAWRSSGSSRSASPRCRVDLSTCRPRPTSPSPSRRPPPRGSSVV